MQANYWLYLIIAIIVLAVFSWIGLAFFGVAILSMAAIGALIGIFIPAFMVLAAFIVLWLFRGAPKLAIPAFLILILAAYFIAQLPGGGW